MVDKSEQFDVAIEFAQLNKAIRSGFPFLMPDLDDTAVVLLSTSLIDHFLKFTLMMRFRAQAMSKTLVNQVFEGAGGALATFSAKINVCIALGILSDDIRHDLKLLKSIRNDFAHSPHILRLSDFGTLSLRLRTMKIIEDDCPKRFAFKSCCTEIISQVCVSSIISLAEAEVLHSQRDRVISISNEMIREIYGADADIFQL